LENIKGRVCLGDLGIDEWITLKWILMKQHVEVRTRFSWLRKLSMAGFCENVNESSGPMKAGHFLLS
jgi:hypothetical protein